MAEKIIHKIEIPQLPIVLPSGLYLPTTNNDIAVNIGCIKPDLPVYSNYYISIFSSRTQYDNVYFKTTYGFADKRIKIPCTSVFINSDGHTVYIFYNKSDTNSPFVITTKGFSVPQVLNNIQVITYMVGTIQKYFITITSSQYLINNNNKTNGYDSQSVINVSKTEFYRATNAERLL